jgi:hypothetical protein
MMAWILAIGFLVVVYLVGHYSQIPVEPWKEPKERA